MNMFESENFLTRYKNAFIVSDNMLPVRQHQAREELMKIEKRFASEIYIKKDLDGRHP